MTGAWSKAKRSAFEESFGEFINNVFINSKDLGGHTCLGDHIYTAQKRLLVDLMDGLEQDIHDYNILKSRQLGISTFTRAVSTFWLGIHDGLPGATVFDTDRNKVAARREIESMIDNLPRAIKFPRIKSRNKDALILENESVLQFLSAGVKKTANSGGLGRSVGLSFAHLSEICSFGDTSGMAAFRESLSDINPNRLYLKESTARGYNIWNEIWEEARKDPDHQSCRFYGWWSKDSQVILRNDPEFERYGAAPLSPREIETAAKVLELYGWSITPEQWAWYRRKMDPTARKSGDAKQEHIGTVEKIQEQPSTEEEAWQQTGSAFFHPEDLGRITREHASKKFTTFQYACGMEFADCRVFPAHNARSVELKVWEEPVDDGVYVVTGDSAFGHDENNDRSAAQVLRCYADGVDQVAEYAWPTVNTRQFGWILASLMGYYGANGADIYFILEMNNSGEGVWAEMVSLKKQVMTGYQPKEQMDARGIRRVFYNVRNYMNSRADAITPNVNAYQFKTNVATKIPLMERLRDYVSNQMLHIRSLETLEEMRSITREGKSIKASGSKKDDRVIALALGIKYWDEKIRPRLMQGRRTREAEQAKAKTSVVDQIKLFNSAQLDLYMRGKAVIRRRTMAQIRKEQWRGRR